MTSLSELFMMHANIESKAISLLELLKSPTGIDLTLLMQSCKQIANEIEKILKVYEQDYYRADWSLDDEDEEVFKPETPEAIISDCEDLIEYAEMFHDWAEPDGLLHDKVYPETAVQTFSCLIGDLTKFYIAITKYYPYEE